jgi:hypothetical protein
MMHTLTSDRLPVRRAPLVQPTHLFAVGQSVRLMGGFMQRPNGASIYRVTATLPSRGDNNLQYRIRSEDECYERVALQDDLRAVKTASGNEAASLLERTFGRG